MRIKTTVIRTLFLVLAGLLLLGCDNAVANTLGARGILREYKKGERDFWGRDASGYRLQGADLSLSNWRDGLLAGTDLTGADISDAVFTKADMRGAMMSNADLSWSRLDQADLREADLSYTDLTGAILIDANLEGTNLAGANLTKAKVAQHQLNKASSLSGATMPDGSVHP